MNVVDLQILIDHIREADLVLVRGDREHLLRRKLLDIQVSDRRQNIGSADIPLRRSRRVEVHGIMTAPPQAEGLPVFGGIGIWFSRKMVATIVAVEPTISLRKATGCEVEKSLIR